ncbi:Fmp40p KABA2_06S03806 [Maudiozyma barnettii]|uniref:Selenoprotein O n=1 Tax=Maudiozyma barnettii TaxID=61262 RepID=A0A8H2VH66_9SACH|nr:Fmp40p [Kazachstania barnettii]CAB4255366.1 similar to Saccharomyces cerevisiae YPL222W FMP40 Putative protein of unknown function [Kazachstania barnettii]
MPELSPFNIINRIKSTGRSRFIEKLMPDDSIKSISQAQEILLEKTSNKPSHIPRITSLGSHFAYNVPEDRPEYKPLITSPNAIRDLQLSKDKDFFDITCGNKIYHDSKIFPYSMSYSGFQFGQFAGQLGDGRVLNLFDLPDNKGRFQTLQLKGSGKSPFSRFADGKAVLRSSIREFVVSEFLHNINVPCARVLQLTLLPGTKALRNGLEPCAVLCRFAPSWIRIGNFDTYRSRPDTKSLVSLSKFCIDEVFQNGKTFATTKHDINTFSKDWFPDGNDEKVKENSSQENKEPLRIDTPLSKYDLLFRHIVNLNAICVAYWQAYGFVNGVLNTDNTSIMGLSLDFGPFGFMDTFDPGYTPNHDDINGMYALGNQPTAIWFNLTQLAHSMALLIGSGQNGIIDIKELNEEQEKQLVIRANKLIGLCANEYKYRFTITYADLMARRLGIELNIRDKNVSDPTVVYEDDETKQTIQSRAERAKLFCSTIVEPLLNILKLTKVDYTQFFVNLQNFDKNDIPDQMSIEEDIQKDENYISCFITAKQRHEYIEGKGKSKINSGEMRLLNETFKEIQEWTTEYRLWLTSGPSPIEISKRYNPLFIPHNWILEEVINDITVNQRDALVDDTTPLDLSLLKKLTLMCSNPFDSTQWEPQLCADASKRWLTYTGYEKTLGRLNTQSTCSS